MKMWWTALWMKPHEDVLDSSVNEATWRCAGQLCEWSHMKMCWTALRIKPHEDVLDSSEWRHMKMCWTALWMKPHEDVLDISVNEATWRCAGQLWMKPHEYVLDSSVNEATWRCAGQLCEWSHMKMCWTALWMKPHEDVLDSSVNEATWRCAGQLCEWTVETLPSGKQCTDRRKRVKQYSNQLFVAGHKAIDTNILIKYNVHYNELPNKHNSLQLFLIGDVIPMCIWE
jgi:hypothetical protein